MGEVTKGGRGKYLTAKAYAAAQGLPVTDELKQAFRAQQRKVYAERDRERHLSRTEGTYTRRNLKWGPILERAAEIVRDYDTPVTLRQLFYRLVVEALISNSMSRYNQLSNLTAAARRDGWFPRLSDTGRSIHRYASWHSPAEALREAAEFYQRDHTEGQPTALYIAVEKMTLTAQVQSWFGDLGIPILSLRGYSSESYEREIAEDV